MKKSNRKPANGKLCLENMIKYIVAVCIFAGIVFQGGYFAHFYISNTIVLAIILLYSLFRRPVPLTQVQKLISALVLLLCFLYAVSSTHICGGLYKGILESCKIFGFGLIILVIFLQKGRDIQFYLKSILYGCFFLGFCGILMYVEIFSFLNGIIINGRTARLQSFVQYANTASVFFGIGAFISCFFLIKAVSITDKLKYTSFFYILMVSTVLTFSRASVSVFVVLFVFNIILMKNYRLPMLTTFILGLITALLLNSFVVGGKISEATILIMGIYLAVLVLNGLLFSFEGKKTKVALLSGMLILTAVSVPVFFITGINRLQKLSLFEGTFAERLIYWNDAFLALKDHLFLGIGPGRWEDFQFYYQTAQYDTKYIHNSFLQVLLDSGPLAFLVFISITAISIFLASRRVLESDRKERFYSPEYLLAVILIFTSIHGLVDMDFSFSGLLNIFGVVIGLAICNKDRSLPLKRCEKGIFTGLTVSILIFAVLTIPGQISFDMSRKAYLDDNITLAEKYCKISSVFRPFDGETAALYADIIKDKGQDLKSYMEMLLKAHRYQPYQPLYLKKLSSALTETNSPDTAKYLEKLLKAAPFVKENYTFAFDCLEKLMIGKAIDKKEYEACKEKFQNLENEANRKVNPLQKHLKS